MLFFVGGFFILLGIIRLIMFLATSGRPKLEVPIKDFVFMKMKSDLFGIGGDQKHAKVSYTVNGQQYEADVMVGKKFNTPVGGNIKITYKPSAPKEAKFSNPKMELMAALMLFIMGAVVCGISVVVTSMLS